MATVIDELAMTLSLDPSKFKEGAKEAEDTSQSMASRILSTLQQIEHATEETQKNTAESAKNTMQQHEDHLRKHVDKHREAGRAIEESFKKVGESIKAAGIELLTFMGIEMTVHGMERLFMDLTKADTAAGFLAQTLGVNIRELGEWQGAAKALGVTANDVAGAISSIGQDMADLELHGKSRMVTPLRHMGIEMESSPGHEKSATQIIQELADLAERQQKAGTFKANEFQMLLNEMGIGQMAPAIFQGGTEMRRVREESRRSGFANEEDVKASRELSEAFDNISQTVEDIERKIKTAVSPAITAVANEIREWLLKNRGWIQEYLIDTLTKVGDVLRGIKDDFVAAFNSQIVKNVSTDIKAVATEIDNLVEKTVGWKGVVEGIFGLWLGPKFLALAARVTGLTSLVGLLGAATNPVVAAFEVLLAAGAMYEFNKTGREKIYDHAKEMGYTVTGEGTTDAKFSKGGKTLDYGGMLKEMNMPNGPSMLQSAGITRMPWEVQQAEDLKRLKETADKQLKTAEEQLALDRERATREDMKDSDAASYGVGGAAAVTTPGGAGSFPNTPFTGSQKEFYEQTYNNLLAAAKDKGLENAEVIARIGAAQATVETGGGQHFVGNNPFGLKAATGVAPGSVTAMTNEVVNGQTVRLAQQFGSFPDQKDAARGFVDYLIKYHRDLLKARTEEEGVSSLGGYATDPNYIPSVRSALRRSAPPVPEVTVRPEKPPQPPALMSPTRRTEQHSALVPRTQVALRADNDAWVLPTETQAGNFLAEHFARSQLGASTSARRSFAATASATDNSRSAETHIGSITVNTQATDATGIARDLKHALKRYDYVELADSGLR